MNNAEIFKKWHCPKCKRVLKIAGMFIRNDKSGTSMIIYDCPVCGKTDIEDHMDNAMVLEEKLPKKSFVGRVRHMVDLVERTDKILAKIEQKPTLKLYYGGLSNA